jgi:superfamily I DNA and/or RNA helicase
MARVRKSTHERDYLERLKRKVMTFDTCQGEERQLVFYSMVATEQDDRTNYVFPKDLSGADEVEEVLRMQRLNVGFSRCEETMHLY